MNINILRQFLNMSEFTRGTVTIKPRDFTYDKGHVLEAALSTYTLKGKKVLVPVTPKQMSDLGFGQFGTGENFWLYTLTALKFPNGTLLQLGDTVEYKNKDFQIISQIDFSTHGFYGQLITSLSASVQT
jgi:hypothetical protein